MNEPTIIDGLHKRYGDLVALQDMTFQVSPGEGLVICGPSGIGKSVLLQSLAGLWPFASGRVRLPGGSDAVMFVPQLPYLPLGDLRSVVTYPRRDCDDDRAIQQVLVDVNLPQLVLRLNEVAEWSTMLSVGEQQRIAFARVLLARPKAVFLDESTSAMDEKLESVLYQRLRTALPDAAVVTVSHRATVHEFHESRLELLGDGKWRLTRLTASG